jgi:hypothetical protein
VLPGGMSLHDAVITAVDHAGDDVILHVYGVQVPRAHTVRHTPGQQDFDLASGTVRIMGVRAVAIDGEGQGQGAIAMAIDSGEILRFDWLGDGQAEVFVMWTQDGAHEATYHLYKIACADVAWTETDRTPV